MLSIETMLSTGYSHKHRVVSECNIKHKYCNLQNAFCQQAVDTKTVVCEAYVKCKDIEMRSIETMLSTGCSH